MVGPLAALKENSFAFSASTGVCFIATTGITGAPRGRGLHLDSSSACEHASDEAWGQTG